MSDAREESNDFPKKAAALQLQLIYFGAVSLGEFKSALNWKNVPDFKAPAFTPWAITGESSGRVEGSGVATVATAPPPPAVEPSKSSEPSDSAPTVEPVAPTSEIPVQPPLSEQVQVAEAPKVEVVAPAIVAEKQVALESGTPTNQAAATGQQQSSNPPTASTKAEVTPVAVAKPEAANPAVEFAAETAVHANEIAKGNSGIAPTASVIENVEATADPADKLPEIPASQVKPDLKPAASEPTPEPPAKPQSASVEAAASETTRDSQRQVLPKTSEIKAKPIAQTAVAATKPTSPREEIPVTESKAVTAKRSTEVSGREADAGKVERPIQRTSVASTPPTQSVAQVPQTRPVAPIRPLPPPTNTAISEPVGNRDDYLVRLEQLVIDLNLQIYAIQNGGTHLDENYTRWLESRVVGLGLENMELKRELQELTK